MAEQYSITVIIPIVTTAHNKDVETTVNAMLAPDFTATYVNPLYGTDKIESRYEEYLDTPEITRLAKEAQTNNHHGVFVDCVGEPGVGIVRELLDIPVIGGFDAPMLTANLISRRYAMITILPCCEPMIWTMARDLGIADNVVSVRNVGIPVPDLGDKTKVEKALVEQSYLAIVEDEAEAIVLGCTGMLDVDTYVKQQLSLQYKIDAQIIDPTKASICFLQALIRCGLTQSRLCYYTPTAEPVGPVPPQMLGYLGS